jgi:hypothetical protein
MYNKVKTECLIIFNKNFSVYQYHLYQKSKIYHLYEIYSIIFF